MNVPQFIVAGTARAGTTALHYYLRRHPQLYLSPIKEPCFFCFADRKQEYKYGKFAFAVTDAKRYEKLFANAKPGQISGEISTPYLYLYDNTIAGLKKYHSDYHSVKIIIVLRNPVDRAYSQYLWKVRDGREDLTFEEALIHEKNRIKENYSFDYFYAQRSLYHDSVKAYLDNFKSVKIILYEDFKNNFDSKMSELCKYLNVDSSIKFDRKKNFNSSFTPISGTLGKMITVESRLKFKMLNYLPDNIRLSIKEQFNKWNSSSTPVQPMAVSTRNKLQKYFEEDILKLQKLTAINLKSWLH